MLGERIRGAKREFDLTSADHQASVLALAEWFLEEEADAVAAAVTSEAPIEARIASLLADSRRWTMQQKASRSVGVVFAMWGEENRLRPKAADNPRGEDSLVTKLEQLDGVTRGTPIDVRLYAVDDGCPYGSATIAAGIAGEHPLGERVKVLSLADHLPAADGPLRNLASPDDSRKGGAVMLGAM
jgi:hypothetical protein